MIYAVEWYFDRETEAKIMALAQSIADAGISTKFLEWKTRPHVTLGCFNDVDEEKCIALLEKFAENRAAAPVCLDAVSMFTDTKVVFLSPTMTESMYRFQSDLHEALREFDTRGWERYLPGGWVPHTTVALTGEDPEESFYRASELVLRDFGKMRGELSSVGLVKISFPVAEIKTIPLAPREVK